MDREAAEFLKKVLIGAGAAIATTVGVIVAKKTYTKVTTKRDMEQHLAKAVKEDRAERLSPVVSNYVLKAISQSEHTVTFEDVNTHSQINVNNVEVSGTEIQEGQVYQIS